MAKKTEAQQELERWETALANLEAQKAGLHKRGEDLQAEIAKLEAEAKDPRGGGFRIGAYQTAGAAASLTQDTIRMLDTQIAAVRAERDSAWAVANQAELIELRKLEKRQMGEIIAATEAYWEALQPIRETWRQEAQLGGSGLAGIPQQLLYLLAPGWHGGRYQWANVDQFQKFDYTAD